MFDDAGLEEGEKSDPGREKRGWSRKEREGGAK